MSRLARERFVNARTILATPPLVPEIALHVAREPYAIWQAASLAGADRPFWAFVWPGGQALARYILDRPAIVVGRHVLDLGCGSAIGGIAAMMSGAASCVAADIDELALVAARCNARTAGVELATTGRDLLAGAPTGWNVILVGDVTYEAALAVQVERFLITARKAGALVLFGDRTTSASRLALGSGVAEYPASVYPVLEDGCDESARVWQIEADG